MYLFFYLIKLNSLTKNVIIDIICMKGMASMIGKVNKYFTFRNFLQLLIVINIILTTIITTKGFLLIRSYNGFSSDSELENEMSIYQSVTSSEIKKGIAASSLVNCINSNVDIEKLPTNITDIIGNIKNYYESDGRRYAFKYQDIYTGFTVSYNENGVIYGASTVKAPLAIYIYELAEKGETDLDKELTYYPRHYLGGTGKIKDMEQNTSFTIRDLVGYAIKNSDNIAYTMLMEEYGRVNALNYWKDLGTKSIFTTNTNWGGISAYDASIYMKELYDFYLKDNDYSNELMDYFLNTTFKPLNGEKYNVANKSGWGDGVIHDVSIVFADNPYILVALSSLGDDDEYQSYFSTISEYAYDLHHEYWKYKMKLCSNIVQY